MFGGLLGALLAIPLGPQWLSGSAVRRRFDQWFGLNWAMCALFLLFPWSQIYPQGSWLGVGVWGHVIFGSIDWGTTVINQVVQETLITGFCWLGVALLLSLGLRSKPPPMADSEWPTWIDSGFKDFICCPSVWLGIQSKLANSRSFLGHAFSSCCAILGFTIKATI